MNPAEQKSTARRKRSSVEAAKCRVLWVLKREKNSRITGSARIVIFTATTAMFRQICQNRSFKYLGSVINVSLLKAFRKKSSAINVTRVARCNLVIE